MPDVRAALLDIDGVLTISWEPVPGAVEAIARLRAAGVPYALVTNTTSRTRGAVCAALVAASFPVEPEQVHTAPTVTAAYLRDRHPGARCLLLSEGDVRADLAGVTLVETDPGVVILGGAGESFSYPAINGIFGYLQRGAHLVAMHRNLSWQTAAGLQLDTGAFLAGLERAAGTEAVVLGKPSPAFFTTALHALGATAGETVMVGDDLDSDVLAAQRLGIGGVLVRTGKYRPETLAAASGRPDHVVDSIADLPALLGRLGFPGLSPR
jgi:HAD superfamily hydrolase (TIGR01458 family)